MMACDALSERFPVIMQYKLREFGFGNVNQMAWMRAGGLSEHFSAIEDCMFWCMEIGERFCGLGDGTKRADAFAEVIRLLLKLG